MTEKTAIICDRCNKIIASKKCEICDKDICEICQNDIAIGINGGVEYSDFNNILHIICCKNCAYGLSNTKLKNYFDDSAHKEIRRKTIEIFKNALLINSLQDNQKEMIEKSWTQKKALKQLKQGRMVKYISGRKITPSSSWAQMMMKGGVK